MALCMASPGVCVAAARATPHPRMGQRSAVAANGVRGPTMRGTRCRRSWRRDPSDRPGRSMTWRTRPKPDDKRDEGRRTWRSGASSFDLSDSFTLMSRGQPQGDLLDRGALNRGSCASGTLRYRRKCPDAGSLRRCLSGWKVIVQADFRRRRRTPRPANPAPNRDIEAGSGMPGGGGGASGV
jgi:hypothetical protein